MFKDLIKELFDLNLEEFAPPVIIRRGEEYYRAHRVTDLDTFSNRFIAEVEGTYDDYTVIVSLDHDRLTYYCSCPHAQKGLVCKHMIAAILEVREYYGYDDMRKIWQHDVENLIEALPKSNPAKKKIKFAAVFFLSDSYYYWRYSLTPAVIKASTWKELQNHSGKSHAEISQLLRENQEWYKHTKWNQPHKSISAENCLNMDEHGAAFFNFTIDRNKNYADFSNYGEYLPYIAKNDFPVFLRDSRERIRSVSFFKEPMEVQLHITRVESDILLEAVLGGNDIQIPVNEKGYKLIAENPTWVLIDDHLAEVCNPDALDILHSLPIKIPADKSDIFVKDYINEIAKKLPIVGDYFDQKTIEAQPIPRLYLNDEDGILRADLRYAYDQYEVIPTKSTFNRDVFGASSEEGITLNKVIRDLSKEKEYFDMLKKPSYRLKRFGNINKDYGKFALRARSHPLDFLLDSIPLLTKAGFEIYGEEMLTTGRINRSTPQMQISISSGIDWFDLQAVIEFGDQSVPLKEMRKALKKGQKFVKLADGSIGKIPDEWMKKYKHLWDLAEETDEGYRIADFQLPLVDELLKDHQQVRVPKDLLERKNRLQNFTNIKEQPLPQGFTGELRPYQKAGFDWLHFLREYNFGGILADDMGLGKTIQILAYLQSRKEIESKKLTTLLIVPKSLITNWQLESERFTPELSFLEHHGNFRKKDSAEFGEYDIILTTYGTMHNDIEFLSKFNFDHIVLDESQAVKNPLSQRAKATRLLRGNQRICMTGTPVENNSFELWSQFAFLNPGLLGSLNYFKKEFAQKIEVEQDESVMKLLRGLIYPFILRRTKKQVAPELPPRLERVLYSEMSPAQKKLYTDTRERYRKELLGVIEDKGMNDVRMKILEGLLRLRQIAIHPALIDKSMMGQSPKFELLLETLESLRSSGHKVLIFSQFITTLSFLRYELDEQKIPYTYLDGKTRDRQGQVDTFQNDPTIPFFLISLKAGGVGLNLTAADYVIHIDPWWNPAVEMQASDRAHRIGQENQVIIYKLITRDTVEEKILELQERKKKLVENLITTESSFFKSLGKDDVKSLFS